MLALLAFLALPVAHALPPHLADAVATGDCQTVTRELAAPSTDEERVAAAWCHARTGAVDKAAPLVANVTDPLWRPYAWLVRLEAEAPDAVVPIPPSILPEVLALPGDAGRRARLLWGASRVLAHGDDWQQAREELRALLDGDDGAEARYWLAEAAARRGDTGPAVATFQRTWADHVRGGWDARSAERLEALGHPVGDVSTAEGRALVKSRIDALDAAHRYPEALELRLALEAVEPGANGPRTLAHATFLAKDYPAAVALWAEVLGAPASATGSASHLFEYALGTSRTGDYANAAVIYRRLAAQHPNDKRADTATFKLGYLHWDRNEDAEALEDFKAYLRAYPSGKHADEALWFSFTSQWSLGGDNLDDAEGYLDTLLAEHPRSGLCAQALFWKAWIQDRKGNDEQANTLLRQVISRYPVSGYAWLAADRVGHRFEPHEAVKRPAFSPALAADPSVKVAEQLLAAGFRSWASAALAPAVSKAKASGRSDTLAMAHALVATGDYRQAKRLAAPHCSSPWKGGDPVAQQACTPRPEAGVVSRQAAKTGLHPLVPYGIMTAESALDPSVTSIAGARGLMQLMPKDGGEIHAKVYPTRPYNPDDLYSAPYNASLGTALLGYKLQAVGDCLDGDDLAAGIAAYNGGEDAVLRWVSQWEEKPLPGHFIRDIGYSETRRYVTRVLGFTMAYRWVYGDAPAATDE